MEAVSKFATKCPNCNTFGNFSNYRCEKCGKEMKPPKGVSQDMFRKYFNEPGTAEFNIEYLRRRGKL